MKDPIRFDPSDGIYLFFFIWWTYRKIPSDLVGHWNLCDVPSHHQSWCLDAASEGTPSQITGTAWQSQEIHDDFTAQHQTGQHRPADPRGFVVTEVWYLPQLSQAAEAAWAKSHAWDDYCWDPPVVYWAATGATWKTATASGWATMWDLRGSHVRPCAYILWGGWMPRPLRGSTNNYQCQAWRI